MLGPVMKSRKARSRAFTLVELMIVVALVAVIAALAAPSLRDMILMQRLRGVQAQVLTDMAFARSEAISRGNFVQVRLQWSTGSTGSSCYIIYSRADALNSPNCNCMAAAGSRCTNTATTQEIRTVQLPNSQSVRIQPWSSMVSHVTFDPRTGGLAHPPNVGENPQRDPFEFEVSIDNARRFKDTIGLSGRITACAPTGSKIGADPCP
jgi:type IV fimbrial biogenesis protein FimT